MRRGGAFSRASGPIWVAWPRPAVGGLQSSNDALVTLAPASGLGHTQQHNHQQQQQLLLPLLVLLLAGVCLCSGLLFLCMLARLLLSSASPCFCFALLCFALLRFALRVCLLVWFGWLVGRLVGWLLCFALFCGCLIFACLFACFVFFVCLFVCLVGWLVGWLVLFFSLACLFCLFVFFVLACFFWFVLCLACSVFCVCSVFCGRLFVFVFLFGWFVGLLAWLVCLFVCCLLVVLLSSFVVSFCCVGWLVRSGSAWFCSSFFVAFSGRVYSRYGVRALFAVWC